MSNKPNVESFIAVLKKSGLVDTDRLAKALADFSANGAGSDDTAQLVEQLIAANLVTKWQSEKLVQGKHRGYFLGKYKLLSLVGKGGMSSVYLAEHLLMRRRCALKVLPAKRVDDSSYLERFHREARAVASLDHPNIVRAYDVDHQNDGDRQIHFLVMEYVEGSSLQDLVTEKGPIAVVDAAEYARQAAAGLQHAHEQGMVHRDIKPGNLLVDLSGVVKILDLGLARFFKVDEGNEALTLRHDEKVLGTADYLAPEQALDSHTVDARADIYSLGCTFYFMLTGQPPFTEGTLAQRLMAHQVKTPPAVESLRTDIPTTLAVIIRKMMEKNPSDRYATAAELENALFLWVDENAPSHWCKAHSAVYGSRSTGSDTIRAIPMAIPVATLPKTEVPTPTPAVLSGDPNPIAPVSQERTGPSQISADTEMNRFFSTLTQSCAVSPESKSVELPVATDRRGVESVAVPSAIPVPASPAPESTTSPVFPLLEPLDFGEKPPLKPVQTPKTTAGVTTPARKTLGKKRTRLSAPFQVAMGISLVALLLIIVYGPSGFRGRDPKDGNRGALKPFPKEKREITVGGKNSEYPTINAALIAVRNRYRPANESTEPFIVRISSGTYKERLRIESRTSDGRAKPFPEGVILRGDGEVLIESSGDEPVIRVANVSRFAIENIQVNAKDQKIAMELAEDLHASRFSQLKLRGFSEVGIRCKGAQGLSFGKNQLVLEQLTFEPANPQTIGIRLEEGADNDANNIVIRGCRFLNPMTAGVVIQGRAPYGIDIGESIFNNTIDGVRIDGQLQLKAVRVTNNSFRRCKVAIRFAKLPSDGSSEFVFRRNLFVDTQVAEALVTLGYDEQRFRTMLSVNPPGIDNNWSDRAKRVPPLEGEIKLFFDTGGKQGEQDFALASTDPNNPKFLAPSTKSPQRDVTVSQPIDKKWVGAIGPD